MKRRLPALAAAAALVAGAALADSHASAPQPAATAQLKLMDGTSVGTATFTPGTDGVLVHLDVEGLEPGPKGYTCTKSATAMPRPNSSPQGLISATTVTPPTACCILTARTRATCRTFSSVRTALVRWKP